MENENEEGNSLSNSSLNIGSLSENGQYDSEDSDSSPDS